MEPQYKHPYVRHKLYPVVLIEVISSGSFHHISNNDEADLEIRGRFKHLFEGALIRANEAGWVRLLANSNYDIE